MPTIVQEMNSDVPCYSTTEVSKMMGMQIPSAFLKMLGFEPALETGNGVYWHQADYPRMCSRIAQRLLYEQQRYHVMVDKGLDWGEIYNPEGTDYKKTVELHYDSKGRDGLVSNRRGNGEAEERFPRR